MPVMTKSSLRKATLARWVKPVTMAEIANACKVSRTTVSYVLTRSPRAERLQPETRKRIEQKALEMGYRPNDAARAIKTGRMRTLAVITPPLRFESNILVVHGIALAGMEAGYQLKYLPAERGHEDADALVSSCVEHMVVGIITLNLPRDLIAALIPLARAAGIEAAQVSDFFPEFKTIAVAADHAAGSRAVIDHLVGLGHKQIALVVSDTAYSSSVARLQGFEGGMQAHGLELPAAYRRIPGFNASATRRETLSLLKLKQRPTAIVCDTDPLALTVLNTVIESGLRVPEDISVTGYVNLPFCEFTWPRLTSVDIASELIGREVAKRLIGAVEDTTVPESPPPVPQLIIRNSTGRAPSTSDL